MLGMSLRTRPFTHDATITALSISFIDTEDRLPDELKLVLTPQDIALYIHTSSATTIDNLKCVPITHESLLSNCQAQVAWFKRQFPSEDGMHPRILGWSPWTHIIGISQDIGAGVIISQGCYIFAAIPSCYHLPDVMPIPSSIRTSREQATMSLTEVLLRERPDHFAGVPWFLEGLINLWENEHDIQRKESVLEVLRDFKFFMLGGAKASDACLEWAQRAGLRLILGFGMTEFGGKFQHWPLTHIQTDDV